MHASLKSETGTVPILVLVAVIGLISFLAIGSFASFNNQNFANLFQKSASQAATNVDVTAQLENLGNPTKAKWADNTSCVYARNVWDMQKFNGKIYLGSGNSDNTGSGCGNAGPIDLWVYEASTSSFKKDTVANIPGYSCSPNCLDTEQINLFRPTNGTLYVPSHDPKNNGAPGIYKLNGSSWTKITSFFDNHNYDVYKYQNSLIGVGMSTTLPAGFLSNVNISTNDGATWQAATGITVQDRMYSILEIGNALYVYGNVGKLYRYTEGVSFVRVNSSSSHGGMIPQGFIAGMVPRVERNVKFGADTVYIGGLNVTDHQWDPVGLFKVSTETNAAVINLPGGFKPRDILVNGQTIYVLGQTGTSPNMTNYVYSSTDLMNWTEILHFSSDTFADSFEHLNGSFYFGMGTSMTPLSNTAGTIYRVTDPSLTVIPTSTPISAPVTPSPNPLPGDINSSGKVDILDYNLLITDYGATAGTGLRSDLNKSGKVDIFDYNLLITNYGKTST